MSEEGRATDDRTAPDGVPAQEPAPDAPAEPAPVGRRSFMRAITGESITTAGKLAGMSGMVAGSLVAAAKAAGDSFSALGVAAPVAQAAPAAATSSAAPAAPQPAAPAGVPGSLVLSDADRATIGSLSLGLLATNQPGRAPAVGIVRFAWDGTAFRMPGRSATARTTNLQRDPFASLSLIDPVTGDALLIAGRVRLVYGEEGRAGAGEAMVACGVSLADGWERADGRGDPILLVFEPQRCFRRAAIDERP